MNICLKSSTVFYKVGNDVNSFSVWATTKSSKSAVYAVNFILILNSFLVMKLSDDMFGTVVAIKSEVSSIKV